MSQDVETFDQTFSVSEPAQLKLANIRGSLLVRAGAPGQVHVYAVKHLGSGNAERTSVEIEQDADGQVCAQTRFREGMLAFLSLSHPCKIDYVVETPPSSRVKASCISSSLTLDGLQGAFDLDSVSGSLELTNLSGDLCIQVVSGEVTGTRLAGSLDMDTVSGAVHCGESDFQQIKLGTVSGDVTLQTPLGSGPYTFNSVSGSVRLVVPDGTACSAQLNTVSGRLHTSLPVNTSRGQRGLHQVDILGGGAPVLLKSVSGGLWIGPEDGQAQAAESIPATGDWSEPPLHPMPPVPPVPPIPHVPPAPVMDGSAPSMPPAAQALSTAEILEQVERGTMSVAEALEALKDQR